MEHLFFLRFWKKTRNKSDRHPAEMPDVLQDLLPIHARHRRIEKDKIVTVRLDLAKAFFAIERPIDVVALLFKGLPEFLADHFLVVHDQ